MAEYREVAGRFAKRPASLAGTLVIVALWLAIIAAFGLGFLGE